MVDTQKVYLHILPGTPREVCLRLENTLVVGGTERFHLLDGNRQMKLVANSLMHPSARLSFCPNVFEALDYIISVSMTKGLLSRFAQPPDAPEGEPKTSVALGEGEKNHTQRITAAPPEPTKHDGQHKEQSRQPRLAQPAAERKTKHHPNRRQTSGHDDALGSSQSHVPGQVPQQAEEASNQQAPTNPIHSLRMDMPLAGEAVAHTMDKQVHIITELQPPPKRQGNAGGPSSSRTRTRLSDPEAPGSVSQPLA